MNRMRKHYLGISLGIFTVMVILFAFFLITFASAETYLKEFSLDLGYQSVSSDIRTKNLSLGFEGIMSGGRLDIDFSHYMYRSTTDDEIRELQSQTDLMLKYNLIPSYVFFESSYFNDLTAGIQHETDLGIGIGFDYEYADLRTGIYSRDSLTEKSGWSKTTAEFWYPIANVLNLYSENIYSFDLDQTSDHRFITENSARIKLSDILSLKIGHIFMHQSQPAFGGDKNTRKVYSRISVMF